MMKKLMLGLAVCECMTVGGMEEHFDAVKTDPTNKAKLSQLVTLCVKKDGKDLARTALKMFKETKTNTSDVSWERIGAMLSAIVYDWDRAGYYGVGNCQHYVNGAYIGMFGPFTLSDFKSNPLLSTSYVDGVFPVPDHVNLD